MHKDCIGDQLETLDGNDAILFECMGAWSRAFCHAWGCLACTVQNCSNVVSICCQV